MKVGELIVALALGYALLFPFNPRLAKAAGVFVVCLIGVVLLFWYLSCAPEGEPFYWLEGVSLWPTEILRLLAAGLSLYFLWVAHRYLRLNQAHVKRVFLLKTKGQMPDQDKPLPAAPGWKDWFKPLYWGIHYKQTHATATLLWQEHLLLTRDRWSRIIPQVLTFWFFGFVLFGMFGLPHVPFRGGTSRWVDVVVMVLSVGVFLLLIFFVVDAMRLFQAFIKRMTKGATGWPRALIEKHAKTRSRKCLNDWLDIRLIAKRTAVVSQLIYYPFIVLSLMIVARMRIFDNWDFPPPLLLIWGLSTGYAFVSAIMLSQAAEEARWAAIRSLTDIKFKLLQERGTGWEEEAQQVDLTIQEIESERGGAFADWRQHPVLKATLLPSGGIGLVTLLEYLF